MSRPGAAGGPERAVMNSAARDVSEAKSATVSVEGMAERVEPLAGVCLLDGLFDTELAHAPRHPQPEKPYRFQISNAVRYCCHGVAS